MAISAPTTRRERLHQATQDEIKAAARRQMAEEGTASLNMRTVARLIGLTPPALYRYYASRDDLLTALIADAFNAHADAIESAANAASDDDTAGRVYAGLMAFRSWAVAHPTEYALIYGGPIPGYDAPMGVTGPAANRPAAFFLDVLHGAWQRGEITAPELTVPLSPVLAAQLAGWRERRGFAELPLPLLAHIALTFTRALGITSLEVFGHLASILGDGEAAYRHEVLTLLAQIGLHVNPEAYDLSPPTDERRPAPPQ